MSDLSISSDQFETLRLIHDRLAGHCADLVAPDERRRASDIYMTTAALFTLRQDLESLVAEIEECS